MYDQPTQPQSKGKLMTSLFLEPFSGISGDMLNGLLVDLGADVELLHTELEKLGVDGFHLHVHRIAKSAI